MKKLDVIVAEPFKDAVYRSIDPGLGTLQGIVGGLVDCLPIWSGHDMWINDEGLLRGLPPNRSILSATPDRWWDIVGTFVICSVNPTGSRTSLSHADAQALLAVLNHPRNNGEFCRWLYVTPEPQPLTLTTFEAIETRSLPEDPFELPGDK